MKKIKAEISSNSMFEKISIIGSFVILAVYFVYIVIKYNNFIGNNFELGIGNIIQPIVFVIVYEECFYIGVKYNTCSYFNSSRKLFYNSCSVANIIKSLFISLNFLLFIVCEALFCKYKGFKYFMIILGSKLKMVPYDYIKIFVIIFIMMLLINFTNLFFVVLLPKKLWFFSYLIASMIAIKVSDTFFVDIYKPNYVRSLGTAIIFTIVCYILGRLIVPFKENLKEYGMSKMFNKSLNRSLK